MAVNDDCTSCGLHAGSPSMLGSLTRLTRLELSLAQCNHLLNPDASEWLRVWRAQRTALGAALRCMPSLSDLTCRNMALRAEDLPALTSLTSLKAGALSPPEADTDTSLEDDPPPPGSMPLPPRLKELLLVEPPSPRLLAALVPPETLASVSWGHPLSLAFTHLDIIHDGDFDELYEGTADAMRGAVQFILRCCLGRGDSAPRRLVVRGRESCLHPTEEESPRGHGSWIAELRPLDLQELALEQLLLPAYDFVVIANCAPNLEVGGLGARATKEVERLDIGNCSFPFSALPLLTGLRRLAQLSVGCRYFGSTFMDEETESTLLVVCLTLPALECLTLRAEGDVLGELEEAVERVGLTLARKGHRAVSLEVREESVVPV